MTSARAEAAYAQALELGYDGTLAEFIESISGKDGVTPEIGENGNWYLGETDTGVKAEGVDGKVVESVALNGAGELIITYTDGSSENLGAIFSCNHDYSE